MHLKRQGQFVCRTLSYHGCTFQVDEEALDARALEVYDKAAELWIRLHQRLRDSLNNGALEYFTRNKVRGGGSSKRKRRGPDSSDDSDFDDSESESDGSLIDVFDDGKGSLRLPPNDNMAVMSIMRYFWSKLHLYQ